MINISQQLAEAIESKSQYVRPKVVARFGDNRHLKNLRVESSNDSYSKIVTALDPSFYWKFESKNILNNSFELTDYSKNKNHGKVINQDNIVFNESFSNEFDQKIAIIDDDFNKAGLTLTSTNNTFIFTENLFADEDSVIPYLTNIAGNKWFIFNKKGIKQNFNISQPYVDIYFGLTVEKTRVLDYSLIESGSSDGSIESKFGVLLNGDQSFGDKEVFPCSNQGVIFRYVDDKNYISATLLDVEKPDANNDAKIKITQVLNNEENILATLNTNSNWTSNDTLKVTFIGNQILVYKNASRIGRVVIDDMNQSPLGTRHGLGGKNIPVNVPTEFPYNLYAERGAAWRDFYLETKSHRSYSIQTLPDASSAASSGYIESAQTPVFSENSAALCFAISSPDFSVNANWASLKYVDSLGGGTVTYNVGDIYWLNGDIVFDFIGQNSVANNYSISYTPPGGLSDDEWYLVTITRDENAVKFYLNNNLVGSISNYDDTEFFKNINLFQFSYSNTVEIKLDHIFALNYALETNTIELLYNKSSEIRSFFDGETFFGGNQSFNIVEEEVFPYISLKQKDNFGKTLITNGEFYLGGDRIALENNYYFTSWQISDESGLFDDDPYIHAAFDAAKATRLVISSGEYLSGVEEFKIVYHRSSDSPGVYRFVDGSVEDSLNQQTETFGTSESVISLTLPDDEVIDEIKLTILSTKVPLSPAVVHEINVYYEADISEDVINFDFSKTRDNYEATLPIGSTSANSGNIALNNTHQKYNIYNQQSPYHGYIQPEIKIYISIIYDINDSLSEEIAVGSDLFVESWNVSSSSMSVDLTFSDWSVVLQDLTAQDGFVFEDIVAGRAARDVIRSTGLPNRKIQYFDSFHRTILRDRPLAYWRLSDDGSEVDGSKVVRDEGGNYDASLSSAAPSEDFVSFGLPPIVEQEKSFGIDNSARSLAALYQITAESVGLEPPKKSWANYCIGVDTSTAGPSDENPVFTSIGESSYSDLSSTEEFAVEAVISPSMIEDADQRTIVSKSDSTDNNFHIFVERSGSSFKIKASTKIGATTHSCEHVFQESAFIDKVFHIIFTKNDTKIALYVNGEVNEINGTFGDSSTVAGPVTIFRSADSSSLAFNGQISHVALYDRSLSPTESVRHYQAFSLQRMPVFPYLYFFDTTYWDGLLEIATGDVGMFYFDEYGNFIYDHKNAFHDPALTQHSTVQHFFDVSTNIVSADHIVDVQTNKIEVKINPKTKITSGVASLWRAETDESLAVTNISESISSTALEVSVANTENPIWPISGYFKIDDEIIKYNSREINKFTELERGQFGTTAAAHLNNALCRETRQYEAEFVEKPAVAVRFPFIAAQIFEGRVDVDQFESTSFGANVVVSASKSSLNIPDSTSTSNNLIYLEGKSPITQVDYFFSIAGIPLAEKVSEERVREEIRTVNPVVKQLRPKELIVDNKFIQSSDYGRDVADFILSFFGEAVPIINVECIGIPHLQLGDLIEITSMPDLNIINKQYWIIETSIQYDGGITQSFTLRQKNVV